MSKEQLNAMKRLLKDIQTCRIADEPAKVEKVQVVHIVSAGWDMGTRNCPVKPAVAWVFGDQVVPL